MTSKRQLEANRMNALKSTGPRRGRPGRSRPGRIDGFQSGLLEADLEARRGEGNG